jgi:hypothetical protein
MLNIFFISVCALSVLYAYLAAIETFRFAKIIQRDVDIFHFLGFLFAELFEITAAHSVIGACYLILYAVFKNVIGNF